MTGNWIRSKVKCGQCLRWLIDPAEKMILVYQPDRQAQVVDILEDELVVPEFARSVTLTAGDVFSWLKLE